MDIKDSSGLTNTEGIKPKTVLKREATPVNTPSPKTSTEDKVKISENINKKNDLGSKKDDDDTDENKLPIQTKLGLKYLPDFFSKFGIRKHETKEVVKTLDTFKIVKKASKMVGFSDKNADHIATNYVQRSGNRTLSGIVTKAGEALPAMYIERKVKSTILSDLKISMAEKLPETVAKINVDTKIAISHGFVKGQGKGLETLAKDGVIRSLPDSYKPASGFLGNILSDGLIGGVSKTASEKVGRFKNIVKPKKIITKVETGPIGKLAQVTKENVIKRREGVLEHNIGTATSKAQQEVLDKGVIGVGSKAEKKLLEKTIAETTEKAIVKATEKTSIKMATRLAGIMPIVGAGAESYIMYKDIEHARDIHKDKDAPLIAPIMADTTVVLDGVSLAATTTGVGEPIGMVASGLSIITSLFSNIKKN
jgi:hypothetical protein